MRNLFVCHTQAQLILATGLSLGRFKNDENHLILFRDFNLSDQLAEKLDRVFSSTLFLTGVYPAANNTLVKRVYWQYKNNRILSKYIYRPYNRVFAVCDWTPSVQYCLKKCYLLNNNTEFLWLEDGITAYFQNVEIRSGSERFAITRFLRKVLFKHILGVGHIYDRDFNGMGGLKIFKQIYCLYPNAVREPYIKKPLVAITDEEYLAGVSNLYNKQEMVIPRDSIILIIDKLDTYVYPEKVEKEFSKLIHDCHLKGQKVYCKFHPREENHWDVFSCCTILDKNVAAESLYLSLSNIKESVCFVGVKSTGLMSARKMGFTVNSIFRYCGETNPELMTFFNRIGVNLIN